MSCFLAGKVSFKSALSERAQTDLGFRLVQLATGERLGIQLGLAIVQPIIFEILGSERALREDALAFHVTDSPAWNTSDAIVRKYAPEYPEQEEPDGPLRQRLQRVERFLCAAVGLPGVHEITLVLSLGYDASYEEEIIEASQFVERAERRYEDVVDVPNVRFLVRGAGAFG